MTDDSSLLSRCLHIEKSTTWSCYTSCIWHTDTPYRQDPNLGEDKDGLLGPKKDKYKVCSLLNKAPPNFGSSAAFSCQFCQAHRYQNRSKGLVCRYGFLHEKLCFWVYIVDFDTTIENSVELYITLPRISSWTSRGYIAFSNQTGLKSDKYLEIRQSTI